MERAKGLVEVRHVKTGAIVAHEVGNLAVCTGDAELDPRRIVFRRELPGIAEQVLHHDPHQIGVGIHDSVWRDAALDGALRLCLAQFLHHPRGDGTQVHG